MKLYSFFASSGAYRVRIALALKKLDVEMEYVDLTKGEHKLDAYRKINPQGYIPALIDGEHTLNQSLSIIEYLEEKFPTPALLPSTPHERARVRAIADMMAMDIAPINNLKIRNYIKEIPLNEETWIQHWTHDGLKPLEQMLAESKYTGTFCHGDSPTLADCVLVPQLFHARRFKVDMSAYPTLVRIDAACNALEAFKQAHPSAQKDAPK